ncbi:hypothetical protein SO802_003137 [Lithocarpus litseifolius]|uniref:CCHC-type domain-containing protein n=1 Tax=Lithocarpus litseifolius TaxID=425828 RepID=A0AAW2DZJ1_9ROSI
MACLNPSDSFLAFDIQKFTFLAKFYPSDFSETDVLALDNQLQTYIVDMCSNDEFLELKGIVDLARRMVETNKDVIYPLVSLQTLYTLNEVVTLSKKIEYQHLKTGLRFSNYSFESSSFIAHKGKQPMFTPRSQPVVRENSSVNQSIVAIASFVVQSIANTNPYAKPTGNKCYVCKELGHRSSTFPKQATMNLVVAEEGEVEGEKEGKRCIMMLIHMPMTSMRSKKMRKACH